MEAVVSSSEEGDLSESEEVASVIDRAGIDQSGIPDYLKKKEPEIQCEEEEEDENDKLLDLYDLPESEL